MAVLSRFANHYWNFTLLGGAFLLAGAYFQDKKVAIVLMFSTLLVSDAIIGFHAQMPSVYFILTFIVTRIIPDRIGMILGSQHRLFN